MFPAKKKVIGPRYSASHLSNILYVNIFFYQMLSNMWWVCSHSCIDIDTYLIRKN